MGTAREAAAAGAGSAGLVEATGADLGSGLAVLASPRAGASSTQEQRSGHCCPCCQVPELPDPEGPSLPTPVPAALCPFRALMVL